MHSTSTQLCPIYLLLATGKVLGGLRGQGGEEGEEHDLHCNQDNVHCGKQQPKRGRSKAY